MAKANTIQFATLHLEGEAHEWRYHGLVNLRHANITSYEYFTQRLIERFDQKNPDIHFKELTLLNKTWSYEEFIAESECATVMVTNISEEKLVMLFTKSLVKPLQGWVKAFNPTSLQEAIKKTRYMGNAVAKAKAPSKPFVPPKYKDNKSFQCGGPNRDILDEETRSK